MLPHSSFDKGTGVPSAVRHRTAPVAASSAYTELRSVAAMTVEPIASGEAYTSPSSGADHTWCGLVVSGALGPMPVRIGSPMKVVHWPSLRPAGGGSRNGGGGGAGGAVWG